MWYDAPSPDAAERASQRAEHEYRAVRELEARRAVRSKLTVISRKDHKNWVDA